MNSKFEPRECPRCGNLFTCTGDTNCWCMHITIPPEVQEHIAGCFEDCLCENCIRELIEQYSKDK